MRARRRGCRPAARPCAGRAIGAGDGAEGELASVRGGLGEADVADDVARRGEVVGRAAAGFELEVIGHRLVVADHGDAFELDGAVVGVVQRDVRIQDDAEHVAVPDG